MKVLAAGEESFLMDQEVRWCEEHPEVPEAAKALHYHRMYSSNRADQNLTDRTIAAIKALRAVQPRPKALVDQFYAWVMWNPNGSVECIPGMRHGQFVSLLMGCDIEHMRGLKESVHKLRNDLGIVTGLRLIHFTFDRVIPLDEVENLQSENFKTKRCDELFAFVGEAPTGDESVIGAMQKGGIGMPFAHPDAIEIKTYLPFVQRVIGMGVNVELRRFVRGQEVNPQDHGL